MVCARNHEDLKMTRAWLELPLVGVMADYDSRGRYSPLELRNCTCGSTLAKQAAARGADSAGQVGS